jgi:hypothetical protein
MGFFQPLCSSWRFCSSAWHHSISVILGLVMEIPSLLLREMQLYYGHY